MRKQAFTDLCDKAAQSFGTTYHTDQKGRLLSGNWLPKAATSPWLTIKSTVRLLGGVGGCSVVMKVVYPLIISSKNTLEITAGFYRKSL